mgnify:CR=1
MELLSTQSQETLNILIGESPLAVLWQYVRTGEYKRGDFYSESIPIIKPHRDEDGGIPKIALGIGGCEIRTHDTG